LPKKIRELKVILTQSGFVQLKKRGKGSHQVWEHPKLENPIIIARKDGADAPRYLEKQVEDAIKRLEL
jgi:predicted RNA binding protein YcfA (HicA-like mRNA interferase family)